MKTEIHGDILIPDTIVVPDCIIHVRLLDTSYADAPARIIHELNISYSAKKYKHRVPFTLPVTKKLQKQNEYSLAVHADLDNDGQLSLKDLIQDRSYSLNPMKYLQNNFEIRLMEIK